MPGGEKAFAMKARCREESKGASPPFFEI